MIRLDLERQFANIIRLYVSDGLGDRFVCKYDAPCIIGAMMPEDERKRLQEFLDEHEDGDADIHGVLTDARLEVTAPEPQHNDLENLQSAFDWPVRGLLGEDPLPARMEKLALKYAPDYLPILKSFHRDKVT